MTIAKRYFPLERLRRKGWKFAGGGFFSEVFVRGTLALKLCKEGYSDLWPEYILFAKEQGELGRQAPMVYALHRYSDGSYAALMERLYPSGSIDCMDMERLYPSGSIDCMDECKLTDFFMRVMLTNGVDVSRHNALYRLTDGELMPVLSDPWSFRGVGSYSPHPLFSFRYSSSSSSSATHERTTHAQAV